MLVIMQTFTCWKRQNLGVGEHSLNGFLGLSDEAATVTHLSGPVPVNCLPHLVAMFTNKEDMGRYF